MGRQQDCDLLVRADNKAVTNWYGQTTMLWPIGVGRQQDCGSEVWADNKAVT
ncbi:hypothetical protein DPMN_110321 [Dreissena polymorpha]|uniref:Uncharacterized protein n=1 Tax=Dreissena polymorpha TaxID=45954 RepID=A0A9D4KBU6_DREPO|nr:hypothetical protein DPMN_110321 [Dreissena polymorpha]